MTVPRRGIQVATVTAFAAPANHCGLYPSCGCLPDHEDAISGMVTSQINMVCRNSDCTQYGIHMRGDLGEKCLWCCIEFVPLRRDPFRGAR